MTFRDWIGEQPTDYRNRNYVDDLELTYLAGQASANEWKRYAAECEKRENDLLVKCAELERERDQWKYTAEIRQQHLEYTIKAQAGEPCKECGQVTPTYDELVKQVSELNRLYKFDNRTMEDLVSKLDAFKVVCEKAARSIEYLLERATDSDDSAYGTLSTNFVRDCLRVNLTELNDVLGLENYVE